jgi:hypothetical protein
MSEDFPSLLPNIEFLSSVISFMHLLIMGISEDIHITCLYEVFDSMNYFISLKMNRMNTAPSIC